MIKYIALFYAKNTNIHHREFKKLEIAEKFCESWNAQGSLYSSHVVTTPPMVDENTYWDEIAKELPPSTDVTWIAYNPDELFGDSSEDLSDETDGESASFHKYDSDTGSRDGEYPLAQRPPLRIIKILRNPAPLRVTRKAREFVAYREIMATPPPPVTSRIEQIVWYFTTQKNGWDSPYLHLRDNPDLHCFESLLEARTTRESFRLSGREVSQLRYETIEGIDHHSQVHPIEQTVYHFTTRTNAWDSPFRHVYDSPKDAIEAHDAFTACGAIVGLIKSSPAVITDGFDDNSSPAPYNYDDEGL